MGYNSLRKIARMFLGPKLSSKAGVALLNARMLSRRLLGNPKPKVFFPRKNVWELSTQDVARALTFSVLYTYGAEIEGDIVEFGTMSGSTAQALAIAILAAEARIPSAKKKQLHLFDSFEGLPTITSHVDANSPHVVAGWWVPGACKVLSLKELKKLLEAILPVNKLVFYKGWFTDTIKSLPDSTRFAAIHFDGDLYSSTMDALDPCFGRGLVSEGAVICFDDWYCNKSSDNFGERRAWKELVEKHAIVYSPAGDYGWGCTKMIIHSYNSMPLAR